MIQRIQSIFLLLISIILILLIFLPLGEVIILDNSFTLFANKSMMDGDGSTITLLPLSIYFAILSVYTLVILFMFKNRPVQIKLARLNGILLAVLIALVVLSADYISYKNELTEDEMVVNYGIGTYLSFIPLILNYLAIKRIRKDEELVRSADRMR